MLTRNLNTRHLIYLYVHTNSWQKLVHKTFSKSRLALESLRKVNIISAMNWSLGDGESTSAH